jgi:4-oxalocrotonate tautomerase
MPTLQLQLTPPQSAPRIAALARELTALTNRVLRKREEVTAVVVEEIVATRWFIGGKTPARPTARLEISITAGTNTAAEKQAFVADAYRVLQEELGALEEASYVVVQELPPGDWGYGGTTQAARRLAATA